VPGRIEYRTLVFYINILQGKLYSVATYVLY